MPTADILPHFESLDTPGKIIFFERDSHAFLIDNDSSKVYRFLRKIILTHNENAYVRKKALEQSLKAVLIKKVKIRQVLSMLIDDWDIDELFLEIERLRFLYLLFEHDTDTVLSILEASKRSEQAELSSEAAYLLAQVDFQNALHGDGPSRIIELLARSRALFEEASLMVENRIDAKIMTLVSTALGQLLMQSLEAAKLSMSQIAQELFKENLVRFGQERSTLYIGFYRALMHVCHVVSERPGEWLHFSDKMNQLYFHFSLLQNEKLENRLFAEQGQSNLVNLLVNEITDPYFVLNFSAEKARINALIAQNPAESESTGFLRRIKGLLEDQKALSNAASTTLEQSMKKVFPHRTAESIDLTLEQIKDPSDVSELVKAFEKLAMPSIERFTDKLLYCCIMLQGNQLYWGNCSEDDRNGFIATMLESADYKVKDQTRWSTSNGGKTSGEIDILVKDIFDLPFTIVEALNLDSLRTDYLALHLNKIFYYDANGLAYNFVLVYFEGRSFSSFWNNYKGFISKHSYPCPWLRTEDGSLPMADIGFVKTVHARNDQEVYLLHIVVDLNKRQKDAIPP